MGVSFDWSLLFVALFIASIFLVDTVRRTRRQSEWKRRWRDQ